jgi:hypothetical protein
MKYGAGEMKPIYFPFTYVSRQTAQAVSTYFKTMVVYQASAKPLASEMQPLADCGFLDVRVPDASDQSRFDGVVKNFRSWGNLHFDKQGVKTAFSRLASEPVPFFNDSATSQIVADVKDELQPKPTSEASSMRFDARVFIELAQQFDRQSYEINQDLGRYDEKIKDLFTDIKGVGEYPNADNLPGSDNSGNNPTEYLILRRLEAWSYLFEQDAADSGILLTGSRFLLEHILDNVPSAEKIQTYKCTPCPEMHDETFHLWQDNLMTKLVSLVKTGRSASADMPLSEVSAENGDPHVSLNLYLLPELRPLDCLAACVSNPFLRSDKQIPTSHIQNTVIGLIHSP